MKRRSTIVFLIAVACIERAAARDAQRPTTIPVKPVVLGESHYDGEWGPQPHDFTIRKQAYWAVLSGAAGHAYGAKGVYDWADPAAMNYVSAAQMKHVSDLFTVRPWHRLAPDLSGAVMTDGAGAGVDYAATARASDGSLVIAYVPTGRMVTINMNQLSGPVTARWFDPTNGRFTAISVRLANSGSRSFTTPGKNAIGHSDWVLVLETSGASAAVSAGSASFPLKVSSNGRHFIDRNNKPFFYQETRRGG